MIHTFFTLRALANEWNSIIRGSTIVDIYSQTADEVTIVFEKDSTFAIRIGVRGSARYIFRSPRFGKPRRNTTELLSGCFGQSVTEVACQKEDRVITFTLESDLQLHVLHFGSIGSVILENDGVITDAFGYHRSRIGKPMPVSRPARFPDGWSELESEFEQGKTAPQIAKTQFVSFSKVMIDELLFRFKSVSGKKIDNDTRALGETLLRVADDLILETQTPVPRLYTEGARSLLSLCDLSHLKDAVEVRFDTVDEAVRRLHMSDFSERRFEIDLQAIRVPLGRQLDKLVRAKASLERELTETGRADLVEKWGHLLMTRVDLSTRGHKRLKMDDLFGDGEIDIPLDPIKTVLENAQRYYDKANRIRRARQESVTRLKSIESRKSILDSLMDGLQLTNDLAGLKRFRAENEESLSALIPTPKGAGEIDTFRKFEVDGHIVLVGKNARQNDLLTFKQAAPHDLWLHARGCPGSHVVLVTGSRTREPSKWAIEKAASIAAHYSKARGSSLVPVIVTKRKFVRKVKGGHPGQVLVTNEDVLLVEPGLPESKSK